MALIDSCLKVLLVLSECHSQKAVTMKEVPRLRFAAWKGHVLNSPEVSRSQKGLTVLTFLLGKTVSYPSRLINSLHAAPQILPCQSEDPLPWVPDACCFPVNNCCLPSAESAFAPPTLE